MTTRPTLQERVTGSPSLRRAQAFGRCVTAVFCRVQLSGQDSIPTEGPVILAGNHTSFLDGIILFAMVRRPASFIVKSEAFVWPLSGFLRWAAQIGIHRDQVDPAPVKLAVALLRAGGLIGIFPEGTRGRGVDQPVKPGVGYFALRSGAAVIPVAITGSDQLMTRRGWRRPVVHIVFGPATVIERVPDHRPLAKSTVAVGAEQTRGQIAQLLAGGVVAPIGAQPA
jgi:1-acyl-sn-glycerol-3-phosphate acyltransferase